MNEEGGMSEERRRAKSEEQGEEGGGRSEDLPGEWTVTDITDQEDAVIRLQDIELLETDVTTAFTAGLNISTSPSCSMA